MSHIPLIVVFRLASVSVVKNFNFGKFWRKNSLGFVSNFHRIKQIKTTRSPTKSPTEFVLGTSVRTTRTATSLGRWRREGLLRSRSPLSFVLPTTPLILIRRCGSRGNVTLCRHSIKQPLASSLLLYSRSLRGCATTRKFCYFQQKWCIRLAQSTLRDVALVG